MFKMFSRIAQTKTINKSGIGLGLMISYKYSRQLTVDDGEGIQVESEQDVGSRFFFILENKIEKKVESVTYSSRSHNCDAVEE